MIVRSVVVLPAPFLPSSIVTSPAGTSKSTPCRMWYAPMCVCTPASESSGGALMPAPASRREAEIGLLDDRRGDHGGRLAVGDELAVVQDDDPVGELADDVHLVLDEQDRLGRVALQAMDQVEDHRHVGGAHAGGRLVEHEDARLERHQHRHLELPLVAVRQAARGGVGAVVEAHLGDERSRPRQRLLAVEPDREQVEAFACGATAPRGARSRPRSGSGTAASAGTRGRGRGGCAPAPSRR